MMVVWSAVKSAAATVEYLVEAKAARMADLKADWLGERKVAPSVGWTVESWAETLADRYR